MAKRKRKILKWFNKKFKLVLYLTESLEAKNTFKFSRIGFIIFNLFILSMLFWGFWVLIGKTNLKTKLPDFPDAKTIQYMYANKLKVDSIEKELEYRDTYLKAITTILFELDTIETGHSYFSQVKPADSLLNISGSDRSKGIWVNQSFNIAFPQRPVIQLYPPLKGVITNKFNPSINHFGTDIVAQNDMIVKAARKGTVIAANYTVETGYTLILQHDMGIITIYRHNKSLRVKTSEKVVAGQAIAVMGNSGENSTGEHLHFEVWIDGNPVNPENYTNF